MEIDSLGHIEELPKLIVLLLILKEINICIIMVMFHLSGSELKLILLEC